MRTWIVSTLIFIVSVSYAQTLVNPYMPPKDIFGLVTDSKGAYSSDTDQASPSPTTGTAYEYNNSTNAYDLLTSADLANAGQSGANRGSPWPQFCINYHTLTGGRVPVIVDAHSYGSTIYAATNTNTWFFSAGVYTKGTLYTNMVTKFNNAIAKNKTPLKGIFIILGINDISNAAAITETTAAYEQLVINLSADFPNTPLYCSMTGLASGYPSSRFQAVRNKIIDLKDTYSNFHIVGNESLLYSWGLYDNVTTPLHFKQAGNNKLGEICARYVFNHQTSAITDKDANSIVSNMYSTISSTHSAGIVTFVGSAKSKGYWDDLDCLQIYRGEQVENIYNDYTRLTAAANGSLGASGDSDVTFTANDKISGNGTNQHLQARFASGLGTKYGIINGASSDFFAMVKTGAATTAAGTLATVFGGTSNGRVVFEQDASSRTSMNLNNATPIVYTTDTKVQSNTWYIITTNGATGQLYKGTTSVRSLAQTPSATASTGLIDIFARNNANPDSPTTRWNGEVYCFIFGRASTVTFSDIQTDVDALLTSQQ
jgi:hypothetical protein